MAHSVRHPASPRASGDTLTHRGLPVLVWVVLPAAWLLGTGLLGTRLDPGATVVMVALVAGVFVGLPLTVVSLSRRLLGSGSRSAPALRVRRPALHQILPPAVPEAPRPPRAALGAPRRAASLVVLALMFTGSLALWTAVPVGWLWIGSHLSPTTRPGFVPYAVIVAGIPLTMLAGVRALYRCDALYARLARRSVRHDAHAAWLRSLTDARQRRPWSTVDAVMTVSVIVAVACMLVWFGFFAEQHSALEPYTR